MGGALIEFGVQSLESSDKIRSYRDLKIWQKSVDLVVAVYAIVETFPDREIYRLVDQLCRSSISIPANIAEGSSRKSTKEFMRFLNVSYGSLCETLTHIEIAMRLKYISQQQADEMSTSYSEVAKMMNALHSILCQKNYRTLNSKL